MKFWLQQERQGYCDTAARSDSEVRGHTHVFKGTVVCLVDSLLSCRSEGGLRWSSQHLEWVFDWCTLSKFNTCLTIILDYSVTNIYAQISQPINQYDTRCRINSLICLQYFEKKRFDYTKLFIFSFLGAKFTKPVF